MDSPDSGTRRGALWADAKPLGPAVIASLDDPAPEVRDSAIAVLGDLAEVADAALPALMRNLGSTTNNPNRETV